MESQSVLESVFCTPTGCTYNVIAYICTSQGVFWRFIILYGICLMQLKKIRLDLRRYLINVQGYMLWIRMHNCVPILFMKNSLEF